jgi:hypothetical protein
MSDFPQWMTEPTTVRSPDSELWVRQQNLEAALDRLQAAEAKARQFQVPYRLASQSGPARDRIEREYREARESAQRSRQYYLSGVDQHPLNQYIDITESANDITAPDLSWWEWFRDNPSILTARPKTDEERTQQARTDFILRKVQAAQGRNASDPMAWSNYSGPGSQAMRADMEMASQYAKNPLAKQAMASPYHYEPFTLLGEDGKVLPILPGEGYPSLPGESLTGSPLGDRLIGNAVAPLGAMWGGVSRFHDNFLAGGAAASEGRVGDAAGAFATAIPNLVSPIFHRGGPGMKDDWRQYTTPQGAFAIDMAAEIPLWMTRGILPRRPGRGLARIGTEDRIRSMRDELLQPLRRRAAQRHHPDVGGSVEAMKRVNAAFDAGDVETLRRMAE